MADLSDNVKEAATESRSVTVDEPISVEEVIEAGRYLKARDAKHRNHLGLHFRKLIPSD